LERAGVPASAIKGSYLEANFSQLLAKGSNPASDLARMKDAAIGGAVVYQTYLRSLADYSQLASENRASWPELALYDCSACHHELRSGLAAGTRPKRNHLPGRPPLATWPAVLAQLAVQQASGYQAQTQGGPESLLRKLDAAATDRPFGDPFAMSLAAAAVARELEQAALHAANTRYDDQAARGAILFLSEPKNFEVADFYTARQVAWA